MNLQPCPCGETPKELFLTYNGQGTKWAEASHCDWSVEFRTNYDPLDSESCIKSAGEAWNAAPRVPQLEEITLADMLYNGGFGKVESL